MFNGYVLYLQAVTTPNPFVKLPKLPFHKSLLLIFCLRLRFPFSFFKLFFPGRLWLFPRGGLVIFLRRLTAPVIFPGWLAALVISRRMLAALVIFPRWLTAPVISPGRPGYFPRGSGYFPADAHCFGYFSAVAHCFGYFSAAATLVIVFWTYFYLYKKICPNNFYFWTYELQISLFMSKFLLNFAVFKHISVVLALYSHFFGHKILFIPDYVQTPSITSIRLCNIHKLIYCTE